VTPCASANGVEALGDPDHLVLVAGPVPGLELGFDSRFPQPAIRLVLGLQEVGGNQTARSCHVVIPRLPSLTRLGALPGGLRDGRHAR
jgi:hypothetical protein